MRKKILLILIVFCMASVLPVSAKKAPEVIFGDGIDWTGEAGVRDVRTYIDVRINANKAVDTPMVFDGWNSLLDARAHPRDPRWLCLPLSRLSLFSPGNQDL